MNLMCECANSSCGEILYVDSKGIGILDAQGTWTLNIHLEVVLVILTMNILHMFES